MQCRTAWFLLTALGVAIGGAPPVHAGGDAQQAPPPPASWPVRLARQASAFVAVSGGGQIAGEDDAGLTGTSPGLAGHLVVGVDLAHRVSLGLAASGGRSRYDNTLPPPDQLAPESHMTLTREALGLMAEGALPLADGPLSLVLGGGVYLARAKVSAHGVLLGVSGEYASRKDVVFESELEGGADLRVSSLWAIGLRGGYTWLRPSFDLPSSPSTGGKPPVTSDSAQVGGPTLELRLTFDATSLRPAQ